jgi:hypothetical protein
MRTALRFALLAAVSASVVGCRNEGWEGFAKATSPNPIDYSKVKGDPYGYGGVADATGGLNAATRYGQGARAGGAVLPGYDQPSKGSGQQRGESPNVATPGHVRTNAPAFQPSPGEIDVIGR